VENRRTNIENSTKTTKARSSKETHYLCLALLSVDCHD